MSQSPDVVSAPQASSGGPLPQTMRVSRLAPGGALTVTDEPVPTPAAGEVLVRVTSVGVCGSDVHYAEHGRIGPYVVEEPMVLGHEAGGVVVAVGEGVDRALVGQRVSVEPGVPQAFSPETLAGSYHLDPAVRFLATPPVDGAFCEYLAHPAAFVHPVPDSVSDDAAALLEPLSVGLAAARAGQVGLGSRVLVLGAGPVGLLAARAASLAGAVRVTVTDTREDRLRVAMRFGATDTRDATRPAEVIPEYDVVIDATGVEAAVLDALPRLAPRGRLVLVGMGSDTLALPVPLVQGRELVVTGTFRYANTWPTAIALAASGAVDLDALVTSHHDLDDVPGALTAGREPGALKPVVHPSGPSRG